MSHPRIHAFGEDALGRYDATELQRAVRRREVSPEELATAAMERARRVNPKLGALAFEAFDRPTTSRLVDLDAPFHGLPTFVKDTVDVAGWPTRHGSAAMSAIPARRHSIVVREVLRLGCTLLGKTTLPEFGFSCTTEPRDGRPTRNPWNEEYSSGGSSGGSAALVAAGVVPFAHGNDGGGSLRIPAASCGLVGLKVTRGRFVTGEVTRAMPIPIVCEGLLTRSVRDSARFLAAIEPRARRKLTPTGLVEGPSDKKLRIALVTDSVTGTPTCEQTRAHVERIARLLEKLGHTVEPLVPPVPPTFIEDFKLYWAMLAFLLSRFGTTQLRGFDARKLDELTRGLASYYQRRIWRTPAMLARLGASPREYAAAFESFDVVLSPVVAHITPKLGYLSPRVPFDDLFQRLIRYTAFTPINNASGSPAIAVPVGLSREGLPVGVHCSAAHGNERVLLDVAYQLESESPMPAIDRAP